MDGNTTHLFNIKLTQACAKFAHTATDPKNYQQNPENIMDETNDQTPKATIKKNLTITSGSKTYRRYFLKP